MLLIIILELGIYIGVVFTLTWLLQFYEIDTEVLLP